MDVGSQNVLTTDRRFSGLKPKFHYADFHRNFPEGKVVDTDHESRKHKR